MSHTYTSGPYHLVFATKSRQRFLGAELESRVWEIRPRLNKAGRRPVVAARRPGMRMATGKTGKSWRCPQRNEPVRVPPPGCLTRIAGPAQFATRPFLAKFPSPPVVAMGLGGCDRFPIDSRWSPASSLGAGESICG